ncbi:MAG: PDZ domain-containing protein, partial [Candidatus Binatia bacterium]
VNGIRVKSLRHLVEILRDAQESQIVFKFGRSRRRGQETMVFDRKEIMNATEEILNDNGIRYPYSEDIRPIWENGRDAKGAIGS